ncbi:MAG: carboxypeptidase regulatory-like domain-containing protein [Acidobacteria bacterium]|nr:carboxypeptidase regulatory-like domain-containing protein [Acidobacteriota bacterium]
MFLPNTKPLLVAAAVVSLVALPALAQDTRGKVQGVVTDGSAAVVAGASATLSNDNTGTTAQQMTSQTGQYLFDFVLPGTYTVTVELQGFKKFVQKNILVQARADVTVNAALEVGATADSITVDASPVTVQFNTSTMGLTLDTKMTNSLPIIHRNPFLLVSLNPATVIRSAAEQSPFHHWAASQFDVGGNTSTKNDIILDGSPSMTAQKSSYTPPMDAVSEVNLQQNAVDAEFGHSAGGLLSVAMKSGTNEWHGTTYYLGRQPNLNALANRITRASNLTRQHTWGATLGNPILKNKLFSFFSYEGWRTIEPRTVQNTLPTDAERRGDFSRSLNTAGALRSIFDPYSTQVNGSTITRTPFPRNIIPTSRIDPTSARIIADVWQPNEAGDGPALVNNFKKGFANRFRYWNFSERVDYNVSDKVKVFGRYNQFNTFTAQDNYTGGSIAQPVDGSKRHSLSFSGDLVYTINANTVWNIRSAYNSIVDSFGVPEALLKTSDLEKFWPGSQWYSGYLQGLPDLYYPGINVARGTNTALGRTGYWFQEPDSYNIESKLSRNQGRHYMKFGGEFRKERVVAARPRSFTFNFGPALTANTFAAPNVGLSGDGWATMLLGALDGSSSIASIPLQKPIVDYWGFFFQDDFKVSQRLTLNLGLRYEYFTAMRDPDDRFTRFLDLTNPIPEFQGANAPVLPAQVTALRAAAPAYNGAWVFADKNNRNSWNAPKNLFLPRAGLAWRVNDKTALRIGWARYIVPATLTDGLSILGSVPLPGFDAQTNTIPEIQGVPQQRISNPFPAGLIPVTGKTLDRYTNLGTSGTWYDQNFTPGVNDRFNVNLQRQLPGKILADLTFFMNTGRSAPFNYDLNQVDPRIGFRLGAAATVPVDNPFFNRLPANRMPGQLRTQRQVPQTELTRPYPQYQSLVQSLIGGRGNRYRSFQMQLQRPFANGWNFVVGYNYNRERNEEFFDVQDNFTRNFTWQPAPNARQRWTGAMIYELPIGKGRKHMGSMNGAADALIGGWSLSGLFTFNTGVPIRWGTLQIDGNPKIDNPTQTRWFDTSKVRIQPAFTRRSNPLQFEGMNNPRFWNVDTTLGKEYQVMERLKFELRMEAYNLTNRFPAGDPVLDPNNQNFGRIVTQRAGVFGRQLQFSGRFIF